MPIHDLTVADAVAATLALFLLSKFAISASFLIIYPFAGELYPTPLRGIGIGCSAYIAGIGLVLIPFINYLVSLPTIPISVVARDGRTREHFRWAIQGRKPSEPHQFVRSTRVSNKREPLSGRKKQSRTKTREKVRGQCTKFAPQR